MDDDINRNINAVDDKDVIEIVVDYCLVFYQQIQIEGQCFILFHLRAHGDSLNTTQGGQEVVQNCTTLRIFSFKDRKKFREPR